MYTTLKVLCSIPSVSGRENRVRIKIEELMAPLADECYTDALGNLIVKKCGTGNNKNKIMLCAHMDEIGFMVTYIEDKGFIRVATVGGINLAASAFSEVVSESGVTGVIVPEAKTKPADYSAEKFVIDIGARSKKEAERRVSVGDFFVVKPSLSRLCGKRVCGRPLDDRVGCAILIEIAREIAKSAVRDDIYYVFSSQEEVGCRGAKTAAYGIDPDTAIIFDVTGTGDAQGSAPMQCALGDGAAIKIKDSSVICSPELVEKLQTVAKKNKIPYQFEILTYGGTDTSSVQMSGTGVCAGAISIPTRYIHSAVETLDLADVQAAVNLTLAFVKGE